MHQQPQAAPTSPTGFQPITVSEYSKCLTSMDSCDVGKRFEPPAAEATKPHLAQEMGIQSMEIGYEVSTAKCSQPIDVLFRHEVTGELLVGLEVKAELDARTHVCIDMDDFDDVLANNYWLCFVTGDAYYIGSPTEVRCISSYKKPPRTSSKPSWVFPLRGLSDCGFRVEGHDGLNHLRYGLN